ncbi:hypothetical protein JW933_06845 [candidate division FCPU426 bacterium]|nr:hypothetical protein [candidate division FCPU426 bacterium]
MDHGIEQNIIGGFLGNLVIISEKQKSENILFDFSGTPIEPINNCKAIKPVLAACPGVERFLPVGKNLAMAFLSKYPWNLASGSHRGAFYMAINGGSRAAVRAPREITTA